MQFADIPEPLPNLMPAIERTVSPNAVHVSECIHRACVVMGLLAPTNDNLTPAHAQLGSAMEHVLASRFAERYPAAFMVPGELFKDGLYGTPDLFDLRRRPVHRTLAAVRRPPTPVEIKLAWMYRNHEPDGAKWLRYRMQLMAYCEMAESLVGELWVTHVQSADWHPVEFVFSRGEIAENWALLQSQRRAILKERGGA